MESLRELYRIGYGPSSSHTMGPRFASERFLSSYSDGVKYQAELYGSLAATGKGHLTDEIIRETFKNNGKDVEILWFPKIVKPFHTNALTLKSLDINNNVLNEETYYSIGGGKVVTEEVNDLTQVHIYPEEHFSTMKDLLKYCDEEGIQLWEAVIRFEGDEILDYINEVWTVMKQSILNGLENEGVLEGGLKLQRKASQVFAKSANSQGPFATSNRPLAYALAVSEENAGGGKIVTAPTCGSCGVLPSVLYYIRNQHNLGEAKILRALLTAGVVGNMVKQNGSISGAEVGCQGEIGVACAMAGAAATQLLGGSIYQIEYAAEMGIEHHLGLTCDPMMGLVQIPCIERNAMASMRSIDHAVYSLLSDGRHKVSFDEVVEVMMETGQALPSLYRETSQGGLAVVKQKRKQKKSS